MKLSAKLILILILVGCANRNGDLNISHGANYYNKGEYELAEKELRKALNKELTAYSRQELFTVLGNTYNELEQYDSSIFYHQKALEIDPDYVEAWVNLGIVYRLTSQFDLAEACYTKAQEIDPSDPELLVSLGALYVFKDNVDMAIKTLEEAIKLDPQLATAYSNYSLALAMNGEFERAEKELKRAVSLGYKNGPIIKERIENLKQLEQ